MKNKESVVFEINKTINGKFTVEAIFELSKMFNLDLSKYYEYEKLKKDVLEILKNSLIKFHSTIT